MNISQILDQEWKPALGCTEPASIAYAAATARTLASGEVKAVHLICDPRIYKNCYAVGVPNTQHKTGIRWALAVGALLPDASAGLECFKQVTPAIIEAAGQLQQTGAVTVEVDTSREELFVDCRVICTGGSGRATIAADHTRIIALERDGIPQELPAVSSESSSDLRDEIVNLSTREMLSLVGSLSMTDRQRLRQGTEMNIAIADHGLSLFPPQFVDLAGEDRLGRYSRLACAGVYARMLGEDFIVMSLVGSGNKGITCSVPLYVWGRDQGIDQNRLDEALALSCLFTSATTRRLGTLSAVCGCSNAAGIGLAAGLVYAHAGGAEEISLAINNMVGNITGMICDGAKIGCALKTMTSVDAAFRCASLAMSGVGIPVTDGIIGFDGSDSLANLSQIATQGMISMDKEILRIMQNKLRQRSSDSV